MLPMVDGGSRHFPPLPTAPHQHGRLLRIRYPTCPTDMVSHPHTSPSVHKPEPSPVTAILAAWHHPMGKAACGPVSGSLGFLAQPHTSYATPYRRILGYTIAIWASERVNRDFFAHLLQAAPAWSFRSKARLCQASFRRGGRTQCVCWPPFCPTRARCCFKWK